MTEEKTKKPDPAFAVFAMCVFGVGLPILLFTASQYVKSANDCMPWCTLVISWSFLALFALRKGITLRQRALSPLYAYAGLTIIPALLFSFFITAGGASVPAAANWIKDCVFWATGVTQFAFGGVTVRLPVIVLGPTYAILLAAWAYAKFLKPIRGLQVLGCGQHSGQQSSNDTLSQETSSEGDEEASHVVQFAKPEYAAEPPE